MSAPFQTHQLFLIFLINTCKCLNNTWRKEIGPNGEDIWLSNSYFIPQEQVSYGNITLGEVMSAEFDFIWKGRSNYPRTGFPENFFRVGFDAKLGEDCSGESARYPSFWLTNDADTMHVSVSTGDKCQPFQSLSGYGTIVIDVLYHVKIAFNNTQTVVEVSGGGKADWNQTWTRDPIPAQYLGQKVPIWWHSNKFKTSQYIFNVGNGLFSNVIITSAIWPTSSPTTDPTTEPTAPTTQPTVYPTTNPPTALPTSNPTTTLPTSNPSTTPTVTPSAHPSISPSVAPTAHPTPITHIPTTALRTTINPSVSPSVTPSISTSTSTPSVTPSTNPTTYAPITTPSLTPTTTTPTNTPSFTPTTNVPTTNPSVSPTLTGQTQAPSTTPTTQPSHTPSVSPTTAAVPTTDQPSSSPSSDQSMTPSTQPSTAPSTPPTTSNPTSSTSKHPTHAPSTNPKEIPTSHPTTDSPSQQPSNHPTTSPSDNTNSPSSNPSTTPTHIPSTKPTIQPTIHPLTITQTVQTTQENDDYDLRDISTQNTDFWNQNPYTYVFYGALIVTAFLLIGMTIVCYCKFKPRTDDDDSKLSVEYQWDVTGQTVSQVGPHIAKEHKDGYDSGKRNKAHKNKTHGHTESHQRLNTVPSEDMLVGPHTNPGFHFRPSGSQTSDEDVLKGVYGGHITVVGDDLEDPFPRDKLRTINNNKQHHDNNVTLPMDIQLHQRERSDRGLASYTEEDYEASYGSFS